MAQFNSKQLAELFKHLTPTGAQALIDHTWEIELKQLLRRIATLLVPYLGKNGTLNPIDKAQVLLALFWITKDKKYLRHARGQAEQYENGWARASTFAIIWQTSREEEDLANARTNALSSKDDEERMSALVGIVSRTGDKPSCDELQAEIDRLGARVGQDKTRLSSHESSLLYKLNGARDTLAIASVQHMGVSPESLRKKVGQLVLARVEEFELWLEVARVTGQRQDADRARSCITSYRYEPTLKFARLAAVSRDPADLAEARSLCESPNNGGEKELLAIATASRDPADIKAAFSPIAGSLNGMFSLGITEAEKFQRVCTLVRLMAEKLDEISKIEVKLPDRI